MKRNPSVKRKCYYASRMHVLVCRRFHTVRPETSTLHIHRSAEERRQCLLAEERGQCLLAVESRQCLLAEEREQCLLAVATI